MKDKKKLIGIIAILLICIIGVSYAYFSAIIKGTISDVTLSAGNMELTISDGDENIVLDNIGPGVTVEKKFKVKNTGTLSTTYDLYISEVYNTFIDKEDFRYELVSNDGGCGKVSTQLPSESEKISSACSINPDITHNYTLRITMVDSEEDQSANIGKVFGGKIKVNEYRNLSVTYNYTLDNNSVEEIPEQATSGYINGSCTNGAIIEFNSETWTSSVSNVTSDTTCTINFESISQTAEITLNYLNSLNGVNLPTPTEPSETLFQNVATTDEGLIKMTDDIGESYIFRGDINYNYVRFAGYYWRIIRINGNGTIRMIYDGTSAHANGESSTDRQIGTSAFNNNENVYIYNAGIGFMYGTPNSNSYVLEHTNTNSSTIKLYLEDWYTNTLSKQSGFDNAKVANMYFCNDRSIYSGDGYNNIQTNYDSIQRITIDFLPNLLCSNINNDLFTSNNMNIGNKKLLDKKIGLITADEVAYAGGVYNTSNESYYLVNGQEYWTANPSHYHTSKNTGFGLAILANGNINYYAMRVYYEKGVRPVINLTSTAITGGKGTMTEPFTIS